jgi:hypothetical protein
MDFSSTAPTIFPSCAQRRAHSARCKLCRNKPAPRGGLEFWDRCRRRQRAASGKMGWGMPPRPDGICRHCCGMGWIVGRGLCRRCYTSPGVRNLYRTYRVKRRALRGATYAHCAICGRWRYIIARERCQSCYRLYTSATSENTSTQAERRARIEEYRQRAARRLPLFSCGNGSRSQVDEPAVNGLSLKGAST